MLYILGVTITHWNKQVFNNTVIKYFWLSVLLFGMFFYFSGPILYYISVIEMKKTLAK